MSFQWFRYSIPRFGDFLHGVIRTRSASPCSSRVLPRRPWSTRDQPVRKVCKRVACGTLPVLGIALVRALRQNGPVHDNGPRAALEMVECTTMTVLYFFNEPRSCRRRPRSIVLSTSTIELLPTRLTTQTNKTARGKINHVGSSARGHEFSRLAVKDSL